MAKTNFENLQVYKLSEKVADLIWDIVNDWNTFSKNTIGAQLVRAADSIGANIAEGAGRGSFKDNKRFVFISRGSLYETKHFLRRAYTRKMLTQKQTDILASLLDELSPKLNSYIKSMGIRKDIG